MAEEIKVDTDKVHKYSKNDEGGRISRTQEFVGLDGISITDEGNLIETKMFQFLKLDPDDYEGLVLSRDEAHLVHRRLIGVKLAGAAAKTPLYCGGAEICPFEFECPFVEIDKVPVGRKCPIEVELIAYWVAKYMDEFEVDLNNQSEVNMVAELAELDIYDYRCSLILSKAENAEMTQEIVVGVDADGRAISNEEIHKAFELKERVKRRKTQILEAMVGTRKEKYKRDAALRKRSDADPSTVAADLKKKIDEARDLLADSAKPASSVIDAEFDEVRE